ncbi:MAG: hypothetical protein M3Q55_11815 [Acidobacteriota bacterium]|nr:hypothetical protein [Acidobacteriota bacterium]
MSLRQGGVALGWPQIDKIINREVRRIVVTSVQGYDRDDLAQEARLIVFRREPLRSSTNPAYIRASVRNGLLNLLRTATAQRRQPTRWGVSLISSFDVAYDGWGAGGDTSDTWARGALDLEEYAPSPEELVAALQMAKRYRVYSGEMKSYGPLFLPQAEVPRLPVFGDADFPECHADAPAPKGTGYDERDPACHQCPDKFSCLPRAIALGMRPGPESVDREVEAVRDGAITYARAHERMAKRALVLVSNGVIPDALTTNAPIERELPDQTRQPLLVEEAPTPPTAPATPPAQQRRRARKAVKAPTRARGRGTVYGPDKLPAPCRLTQERLADLLAAATERLGFPRGRSLEVGHVLVKRRHRSGKPDVEVEVVHDGFRLNLDGEVYGSLSSCAIVAEQRMVSGNVYFSLSMCHNVEIRDRHGSVICTKRTP